MQLKHFMNIHLKSIRAPMRRILFYAVILGFFAPTLWAQDRETVVATRMTPLKSAAYQFFFRADANISPGMEIDVVFPKQFNLTKVLLAASDKITSGFTVSVHGDTVRAKRTNAGITVLRGEMCDLKIASIINPQAIDRPYQFTVLLREGKHVFSKRILSPKIAKR